MGNTESKTQHRIMPNSQALAITPLSIPTGKAEAKVAPKPIPGYQALAIVLAVYVVLPALIVVLFANIGRDMMSDADKAYVREFVSYFPDMQGRDGTSYLEIPFYIYTTPVFLIPLLLYEISKRLFQPISWVFRVVETIAVLPFLLLGYPWLAIYSMLTKPDEDPLAGPWNDIVDRLVLTANTIGTLIFAAFQARLLMQMALFLTLLPILAILSLAILEVFGMPAGGRKKA